MKRKFIYRFTLFIIVLTISCSSNDGHITEVKTKITDHVKANKIDAKYILVLPTVGCPGCISNAEIFLQNYSQSNQLCTILTNVLSKKGFEINTGISLSQTDKIHVDLDNNFLVKGENKIYPCLFTLNQQKEIVKVEFQQPGQDVFSQLELELKED